MKKTVEKKNTTAPQSSAEPVQAPAMSFETALEALEGIVRKLEQDDLTLSNALDYFEQGINLMRTCDTHLNHARGRITELLAGENGAFAEEVLGTSLESFLKREENHD